MAAVWIGAALWDILKDLPDEWRGDAYRHIEAVNSTIFEKIKDLGCYSWYHASRDALPLTITTFYLTKALIPTSFESLMSVVAIENVLARTAWTLVDYKTKLHLVKG